MAQATPHNRSFGAGSLIATLFATEFRRLLFAKKTIALGIVELLPVVAALIFVVYQDIDGMAMFHQTIENVTFPFLLPLAAIFYGGPALVDEMEGRTLTYLTLRPVPKPVLFLGKWLAGFAVATLLVVVPVLMLLGVGAFSAGEVGQADALVKIFGATILGIAAYTAIFAALGALFARSLISGIIYFVVFEMIFASLPVLELLSLRYYMRTSAGFAAADRLGFLDQLVLDKPLVFDWWVGVLVLGIAVFGILAVGAGLFRAKQYHV